MTLSNPILEKVFLALRPNFFPEYHREHITLRYYNQIRWDVLLQDCLRLEKDLPATINPLVYSSWKSNVDGKSFQGLLVESKDSQVLDHLEMPHVTLPNDIQLQNLGDAFELESQVVDTLWVGKKIDGQLIWARFDGRPVTAFKYAEPTVPPNYPAIYVP